MPGTLPKSVAASLPCGHAPQPVVAANVVEPLPALFRLKERRRSALIHHSWSARLRVLLVARYSSHDAQPDELRASDM
jgi:hypothetical protein